MNRERAAARPLLSVARPWWGGLLALTLAIGVGLLLAQLLMSPTGDDLRRLAAYLTLSGAATMGVGWLCLRAADHAVGLAIQSKAFLSAIIAGGVALLNVFIVAQLMFVSTSHDLKLLIALIAFSAIVTVFFSLWVASTIAGRIRTVAAGIRSLATGNYATRVHVSGGDEVTQLAEDTNALASRLAMITEQREALDRERRELTAAISHDLRTPLASVRAMVEALDDEVVQDPAEVGRYYRTVRREVERLSRMIDDLFELARMDAGALQLDRRPLALQEIAAEVADAMQLQARHKSVTLSLSVEEKLPEASLDGPRIERVVANLIRNALEHTPTGGRVEVNVFADNDCIGLRVSDSGEGIAPADLPHIWERFYRADKSRRRSPQEWNGAGIGLAIVRGIIEAHGGTVEATSVVGRGTTFTVRLPR